jgi:hypothetical protein
LMDAVVAVVCARENCVVGTRGGKNFGAHVFR